VFGARVEQRQDVRVLQLRGNADLAQEAIPAKQRGEFLAENLDRDIAIVFDVVREIHGGHATGAEFTLDAVAAREGR